MIEERIKELAEKFAVVLRRLRVPIVAIDLGYIIRTVAAEARKEGIEEMEQKGDQIIQAARSKPTDLRTISFLLHEEAGRLKEQG